MADSSSSSFFRSFLSKIIPGHLFKNIIHQHSILYPLPSCIFSISLTLSDILKIFFSISLFISNNFASGRQYFFVCYTPRTLDSGVWTTVVNVCWMNEWITSLLILQVEALNSISICSLQSIYDWSTDSNWKSLRIILKYHHYFFLIWSLP